MPVSSRFNRLSAATRAKLKTAMEKDVDIHRDARSVLRVIHNGRSLCTSQISLKLGLDIPRVDRAAKFLVDADFVFHDIGRSKNKNLTVYSILDAV